MFIKFICIELALKNGTHALSYKYHLLYSIFTKERFNIKLINQE